MAEEPQPSDVHEGASEAQAPTGSAEDRKAAAALSTLDAREDDSTAKKDVDSQALGEAMKNLKVQDKEVAVPKKKTVKIDPVHVTLLVNELELSKAKATELLRAHNGDPLKAIHTWITPNFQTPVRTR